MNQSARQVVLDLLTTDISTVFRRKAENGFSLLELILVMVLVGIAAVMVAPFVGHVLSNLLEGRELSNRETQAAAALERFVRDVRRADAVTLDSSQQMTLSLDGSDVIYLISSGSLQIDGQILARYLAGASGFSETSVNGFSVFSLSLALQLSGVSGVEFSTSAVPRFALGGGTGGTGDGGDGGDENEEGKGKGDDKGKGKGDEKGKGKG